MSTQLSTRHLLAGFGAWSLAAILTGSLEAQQPQQPQQPPSPQWPNHLHDRFQLTGSLSAVRFTTSIRVDSEDGEGTDIDVEDDLGANETVAEPRLGLRWNISPKHSLEFGYLFARRGNERTISRDIEYEGETYTAGLYVKSKFDSDLASLTWRWAFHSSEKSRIGATVGVGALLFRTGLDGYVNVDDEQATVSAGRDLTAPVGGIGGFGHWRLGPQWFLELELRGIYVPIDRYEAYVVDLGSAIRWFPFTRLGVEGGLAWNAVRVDINKDPEAILTGEFDGRIKYRLASPRLGVVFSF